MRASGLKKCLHTALITRRPVFVWGKPGAGKSQIISQVIREAQLQLEDQRTSLLEPVDLRGLPNVQGNLTHWNPPVWFPREGNGVLFLDEMNLGSPAVMSACYQLVLDRRIGEAPLPDGWVVWAAGNSESDRCNVNRMSEALKNRFWHLTLEVHIDDWSSWAVTNGIRPEVVAYCRMRPELLHKHNPKSGDLAYPTPRSWAFLSETMDAGVDKDVELEAYAGYVGEATAAEFVGFLRIFRGLPDPRGVLEFPDNHPVPSDPSTLFALMGAIARIVDNTTVDGFFRYLSKVPQAFSIIAVRDAFVAFPKLHQSSGFKAWARANSDVIL
jgi:hypothetical protein